MTKKKKKSPFDFGFWNDDDFSDIFDDLQKMMRGFENMERFPKGKGKSFVWGFNARMGPEGKWNVEEFGNRPKMTEKGLKEEREPLVDIIKGKKDLKVIFEIPGVSKSDINLKATEKTLKVKVETPKRKYSKEVTLPSKVKPKSTKASYKNGVLEVDLELKAPTKPEKAKGHKVEIE